jgi:hypothetical protein
MSKKYKLKYLPLFFEDLEQVVNYIRKKLHGILRSSIKDKICPAIPFSFIKQCQVMGERLQLFISDTMKLLEAIPKEFHVKAIVD